MFSRRKFISRTTLTSLGIAVGIISPANTRSDKQEINTSNKTKQATIPLVISTWENEEANKVAMDILKKKGKSIDAVEAGVRVPEGDPKETSVGFGGMPDREGHVTLDACIMDSKGRAGAVCFLEHIKHPISVARKVMEETPHVILAGEGALKFALENGFEKENLLTEESEQKWKEWKVDPQYKPIINIENHDTIGMLAIDKNGDISGACTTSGLAYKMQGRVGDSPIIGAGLFIDNEIGGATSTGMGEAVLKTLGSFLVVELMRQGLSPQDACEEAVMRIVRKQNYKDFQVGYLAVNKKGEYGAYCIHSGFNYVVTSNKATQMLDSESYISK